MTHTAVTLKGIVFHLGTLMFTTELVNSIFHLGKVTIYPLRFFFAKQPALGKWRRSQVIMVYICWASHALQRRKQRVAREKS